MLRLKNTKNRLTAWRQRGFTLIEVMVVVVIIAILAAIIVPNVMKKPDQVKQVAVQQDILSIQNALDLYKLDNGTYPSTDQGLEALVKKPESDPVPSNWQPGGYLKTLPQDPWGHPYRYENPGLHSEVDVYSMGASDDDSTIIGNWSSSSDDDSNASQ